MQKVFLAFALPQRFAKQCAHLVSELKTMRLSRGMPQEHVLPLTEHFETGSSTRLHSRLIRLKISKALRPVKAETRALEHDKVSNVLYLSFEGKELGEVGRYLLEDLRSGGFKLGKPSTSRVLLAGVPSGYRLPMAINLAKDCAPYHELVQFDTIGVYSAETDACVHSVSLAA